MSVRTRLVACVLVALLVLSYAQALDPSTVALNAASAEKFVRATQEMAASGKGPNMQGGPGLDLAKVKASIDANAAAQKALADAGISSTDYVLFLGAAMQSMSVETDPAIASSPFGARRRAGAVRLRGARN